MSKIVMVTGGARSGKSSFAQSMLKNMDDVLYLATSVPFDDEMKDRVKKHRESRPKCWTTAECYKDIDLVLKSSSQKHVLLDCLTIMVTNLMFYYEKDWENISMEKVNEIECKICEEVTSMLNCARDLGLDMVIVTNELGMGIVPSNKLSRIFRDIAGRINQLVAKNCDQVYFVVSGIPMKIK